MTYPVSADDLKKALAIFKGIKGLTRHNYQLPQEVLDHFITQTGHLIYFVENGQEWPGR